MKWNQWVTMTSSPSLRGTFSLNTTVASSVAVIDSQVAAFIELNWLGSVKPLPRPVYR